MLRIHDNIIEFTKGDSVRINVNMRHHDGYPYRMQVGDTLTMTIRKSLDSPVVLQAVSTSEMISLTAEQTKGLEPGACCYDIELKTQSGEIYTIAGVTDSVRNNMRIWPEVST